MRSEKYYRAIKVDGEKVDYHRHLVESLLGRTLSSNEVIHHIDGDIHNNDLSNLQVMTRSEHSRYHTTRREIKDETRQKLSEARAGKPNYYSRKLTDGQALKIFKMKEQGMTFRAIGKKLGVCHQSVIRIYNGTNYQDIKTKGI